MKLVWNRDKRPWDRLQLIAGPATMSFPVQAQVVEQDRNLLLSEPSELAESAGVETRPAWYLANLLETQPDFAPGSVVCVCDRQPLLMQAVVHDIESSPTWRLEWVELALRNILAEVASRNIHSLGLPFLGTRHGDLDPEQFVALLQEIFPPNLPECLRTLWLISPKGYNTVNLIKLQD